MRVCPRCQVEHRDGDFRGEVCGWCADDLEMSDLNRQWLDPDLDGAW